MHLSTCRLDTLHNLLNDLASHPRVLMCADTVPILLRYLTTHY